MRARLKALLARNRSLEGALLIATAMGFVSSILIARSLGPAGRGDMTFIAVWIQVLGFAGAFMLDTSLIVLSRPPGAVTTPREGFHEAVRISAVLSSGAAIVAAVLGWVVLQSWFVASAMAVGVIASAALELWNGYLLASGRRSVYIANRVLQPALYTAFVFGTITLLRDSSIATQVAALAGCLVVSVGTPAILEWSMYRPARPARAKAAARALIHYAGRAQIASMVQYVNARLDLLVMPFRFGSAAVGVYAIGAAPAQVLVFLGSAGALRGITGEATVRDHRSIWVVAMVAVVWIVLCPWIIPWVFGTQFAASVPIAQVLALGAIPGFALQQAGGRLLGQRRPLALASAQGIGGLVFVVGFILAATPVEIAWSSAAAYLASLVVAEILLVSAKYPATQTED
jgi:O-antigen/teichoic acid export membrane protein